jgi:monoamine oxidase
MKQEKETVLIVGAGIAGLTAARELLKEQRKVIILEALNRPGGRIHTISDTDFALPVELGAEFIHGKAEHTFRLIKEYGLEFNRVKGAFYTARHRSLEKNYEIIEDDKVFEEKLKEQEEDITVNEFLSRHFSGLKYQDLADSVRKFVEGYDAADPDHASILALKKEWLGEDWQEYRIAGGYIELINEIMNEVKDRGGIIRLGTRVNEIHWGEGSVTIKTDTNEIFRGEKVIVTLPLGSLLHGGTKFYPDLREKFSAGEKLGFGSVIKIVMQFSEAFWKEKKEWKDIAFIFSNELIPTWWTQLPDQAPILTGWLGGPPAQVRESDTDESLLEKALISLSSIFEMDVGRLRAMLVKYHLMKWTANSFSHGAYTYATVNAHHFVNELRSPVKDTIYFAGEGFYWGENTGTVEAAIVSAFDCIKMILKK